MHPSLDVANFSRLPPSLKSLAVAAASGSEKETLVLLEKLLVVPPRHRPLLLPAFHSGLDPARIKKVLTLFDSLGCAASVKSIIAQVEACLGAIGQLGMYNAIPHGAFVDVWENVWSWIQFLDEYQEVLFHDDVLSPAIRYRGFLSLIRFLRSHDAVEAQIDSNLSRWGLLGRAWCHFIDAENEPDAAGLEDVTHFLGIWVRPNHWNSAALEELVRGAGGTREDLASLVVSHIRYFVPRPDCVVTQQTVVHILAIICIIGSEKITGHNNPDRSFQDALSGYGIVPALTTASRALSRSTPEHVKTTLDALLATLAHHISRYPLICLRKSLRAGLLEILFNREHRQIISPFMVDLLEVIFPATVYRSVLVPLQASLLKVRDRDAEVIFCDAALLAQWGCLLEVVESRSRISKDIFGASKVCEDLECANICPKHGLKRCSGCLTANYCSKTCQRNDWRRGEHRQICGTFLSRRKQFRYLASRDQSFLGALIRHEHAIQQKEIKQKQRVFAQTNPCALSCLIFDFTSGICWIELIPLKSVQSSWANDVERATRSDGQLQLHFIKVMDGPQSRMWPFHVHLKGLDVPTVIPDAGSEELDDDGLES
ncbi:MYND-type domain-containing protein [Mycena sanguinolenta]|uniref:MYND-type domain-containing protein n=1 Tax=Mycena sanguinolenta TaxID=230812 RepID=A0A8H6XSJ0_9AGAR|nr:MYND-type domain-containing protein [Mycena sanguinolenta]